MARTINSNNITTLQMALVGYQVEKQKIEDRIREIQFELKGKQAASPAPAAGKKNQRVKRVLSPAARRRISSAQKRRWAEHRKKSAAAAKQE